MAPYLIMGQPLTKASTNRVRSHFKPILIGNFNKLRGCDFHIYWKGRYIKISDGGGLHMSISHLYRGQNVSLPLYQSPKKDQLLVHIHQYRETACVCPLRTKLLHPSPTPVTSQNLVENVLATDSPFPPRGKNDTCGPIILF